MSRRPFDIYASEANVTARIERGVLRAVVLGIIVRRAGILARGWLGDRRHGKAKAVAS